MTPRKRERYKDRTAQRSRARGKQNGESRHLARRIPSRKDVPVNKSEMIDAIARHADISKAAAGRALDATVGAIKTSLRKGDIVTLVGFGSFYVGKRSPRAGRNPRTGDAIRIQGGKVPKFRAGKALKDALN
ncbi:MAG TPA: HU family DNA-binding protein [Casimicrobiaceae bacterium]|nr:HU family DNA-binding protein [Casimicrobiaceae bacterium]